jgi:hypothetical protein
MKWDEFVHTMTLGKYQTTFFFKNRQYHASKVSILFTIFCVVTFLIFSVSVLKDIFTLANFRVSVVKVGDKTLPIETLANLTLVDYMTQSETIFDIKAYRNFSYLDEDLMAKEISDYRKECGGFMLYLSYLF